MSRSILLGAATAIALTAAVPFVPAIAQGDSDRADASTITVYSPLRVETQRRGGQTERVMTSSRSVFYDDLNLRTQWGRDQLDDRIKLAAEQTCDFLDNVDPFMNSSSSNFDCVRKAVRDARPQVYLAIANYDREYAYNDYYNY